MNSTNEENRCHICIAKEIKYEKLINGNWVEVNPIKLKKGDSFRCFDKNTDIRLETERADDVFTLYKDYDGKKNLPNSDYVL